MVDNAVPSLKLVACERVPMASQGKSGPGLEAQRKTLVDLASSRQAEVLAHFTEVERGGKTDRPELAAEPREAHRRDPRHCQTSLASEEVK